MAVNIVFPILVGADLQEDLRSGEAIVGKLIHIDARVLYDKG